MMAAGRSSTAVACSAVVAAISGALIFPMKAARTWRMNCGAMQSR